MALISGARLGPYEILSALGAGGMGEVWKARDTRLDRTVAIKTIRGPFTERFEREARAISALSHPHICAIYDVGEHDGAGYLVLEYVEGEPLKGPLPLDHALKYGAQICGALDAAHGKGIIHRDLKPDNILLTKAGVKLLDFGLAKAVAPAVSAAAGRSGGPGVSDAELAATKALTGAHMIVGTPQYMAPEQIEGRDADARTDLFAFGCVLYELLTGQKAFDGKTPASTMAAILATEPRPMRELQPVTPAAVERVVGRCLAKDPDDRWQTAKDLKAELEWIAERGQQPASGVGVNGGSTALEAAEVRRTSRNRLALAGAGTLTGLLVGAIVVWMLKPEPTVTAPVLRTLVSVAPADQLRALPFDQSAGEGRPSRTAIALSADGRSVVFSAVRGDRQQLYLRRLDELEATPIPGTEDAVAPFLSPDGAWVGFWSGDALRKVGLPGGGPATTICETPVGPYGASWGSNDTIVFAGASGGLWRVSAAGGTPEPLTALDAARGDVSHRLPQLLPGNQAVLFTIQRTLFGNDTSVAVQSLATGARKIVIDDGADARYVRTGHLIYVRRGTLMAVPFDLDRLAVAGGSVALVGDLMQAVNGAVSVLNSGAGQFSVSASGSLAYVPGGIVPDVERTLTWVDRTGVGQPLTTPPRFYVTLRLSPDGQRVAVAVNSPRDQNIWIDDIQRGMQTRLTSNGVNSWPAWTPDGTHIAFASAVSGNSNLFWTAADGSGKPEQLTMSEHSQFAGSWTPDGQTLAFIGFSPATGFDVWVVSLSGDRQPRPILQTRYNEYYPAFSPDGRWLAYVSNESDRTEVYVQPYPGPGGRQQVSTGGAVAPAWSGDGRELFYLAPRVLASVAQQEGTRALTTQLPTQAVPSGIAEIRMMAVAVTAGSTFSAGTPRVLFEGRYVINSPTRGYDVTRDGRRFLMIQEKERPPIKVSQIILVQNWFDELKRRVPTR